MHRLWYFTLGLSLLILSLPSFSFAILGGTPVQNNLVKEAVHSIDTRIQSESIVCTATSINSNQVLTAAHCFRHWLEKKCFTNGAIKDISSCNATLLLNDRPAKVKSVALHPRFLNQREPSSNYLNQSNFDVAVVTFSKPRFRRALSPAQQADKADSFMTFYGYGMSQIKNIRVDNQDHFLEENRGVLKELKIENSEKLGGLIRLPSSKLTMNQQTKKYQLASGQGHILRSDSGGPLIAHGKIFGIARNYHISNSSMEASRREKQIGAKVINNKLTINSTFTDLRLPSIQSFINKQKTQ